MSGPAQFKARSGNGRPWIDLEIGLDDFPAMFLQQNHEGLHIESVSERRKRGEVLFRQLEKADGRAESPAVLGMGRVLKVLLQMDESSRTLDQAFEKIIVVRVCA